jgi:hypothetical protein
MPRSIKTTPSFTDNLRQRIHTLRGVHVLTDEDLADLYGVPIKVLNQAVKRNQDRFPSEFCFQLNQKEFDALRSHFATLKEDHLEDKPLRSQIVTLKKPLEAAGIRHQRGTLNESDRGRHRKYLPYAFTEQGVAMLSTVLRSQTAIQVSIHIMRTFVEMRRTLQASAGIIQRLDTVEKRQLILESDTHRRFEQVFTALEGPNATPRQGVFYDGQIHDAHTFVSELIRSARKSVVLIDNYADDSVLTMLGKRAENVSALLYVRTISPALALDLKKHNAQYLPLEAREFTGAHDRFLILDGETVYHIGASLKDLGKKWFAFSRFDKEAVAMLERLP